MLTEGQALYLATQRRKRCVLQSCAGEPPAAVCTGGVLQLRRSGQGSCASCCVRAFLQASLTKAAAILASSLLKSVLDSAECLLGDAQHDACRSSTGMFPLPCCATLQSSGRRRRTQGPRRTSESRAASCLQLCQPMWSRCGAAAAVALRGIVTESQSAGGRELMWKALQNLDRPLAKCATRWLFDDSVCFNHQNGV